MADETGHRTAGPEEIAEILRHWSGERWRWSGDRFRAMLSEIGWTERDASADSLLLDTGLPGAETVVVPLDDAGAPQSVVVLTTPDLPPSDARLPATKAFLRDAFAELAGHVEAALGTPVYRRPGENATIRWDLPKGAVRAELSRLSVQLVFYTPAEIKAAEADEALDDEDVDDD